MKLTVSEIKDVILRFLDADRFELSDWCHHQVYSGATKQGATDWDAWHAQIETDLVMGRLDNWLKQAN